MSITDSNTNASESGQGEGQNDSQNSQAETDWQAEANKWKSLARQNEKVAKSNAEAAKRLAELEEADKSETEKLASERDQHRTRADSAELSLARLEVALDKGLTRAQAKRLVGSTREELEADADELLSDLGGVTRKPGSFDAGAKTKTANGGDSSWFANAIKANKR